MPTNTIDIGLSGSGGGHRYIFAQPPVHVLLIQMAARLRNAKTLRANNPSAPRRVNIRETWD